MKSRFFVFFSIVIVFIALAFLFFQNKADERFLKQLSLQKAEFKFNERDTLLKSFINKFDQTIIGINENKSFTDFVQNNNNIELINELFLSLIKSSPSIVQFRYINSTGDEIIRVDKKNQKSFIVPKDKLQNKKNRYYFKDIHNTKVNTIWHSKIDLNVEYGNIVRPIEPTLRIGTPVVIDGINHGVLIINIDINSFLDKLQTASIFNIYIIDKDGDFLVHFNDNYSWGKYLNSDMTSFTYFKNFSKELLLKDEIISEDFYARKTSFRNDDDLTMIIELKKSKILEQMKEKSKIRLYWMLLIILIIISLGYIFFKRRHIKLVVEYSEELSKQKQSIQNILDTQSSIVILTNGSYMHDCNKQFLNFFGYESLDSFKKEYDCICDFFESDEKYNYLQKTMDDIVWNDYILARENETFKTKMTDKNDNTHIFQVNAKVYDLNSKINEMVITFNDVTKLENLNDNLERIVDEKTMNLKALNETLEENIKIEVEKNREKDKQIASKEKLASMGEMIGNIAHQWRQPLSVISTAATGLQLQKEYDILSDEHFFKTCSMINENAQYLSQTINDFRDFIEGTSEIQEFDLTDTINSFLSLINHSVKETHIKLSLDLQDGIKTEGYPNELIQCMINIFNNSKDALSLIDQSNRYVFIKTHVKDNNIYIKIKDNGGGIPEDILPKIFDPYFTTKHKSQGTGLGLHMIYNLIVNSMNGNIEGYNTTYTFNDKSYNGAEFLITLPLHK